MDIKNVINTISPRLQKRMQGTLVRIILYGSCARNEANDDSDIDIALVIDRDVSPGEIIEQVADIINDINLDFNVLVSVYPVSEKKYNNTNSPLLLNIRKEGKTVWKK
ncbi:MAG: nucleotidyltransferase domain-containing protein [Spirochaetales bacterium]|nr:nucleotidyltransferase domain-containing protein [Spirochaetales bacterium]